MKGAPETIFNLCSTILYRGEQGPDSQDFIFFATYESA
jgi:hypothetical protein